MQRNTKAAIAAIASALALSLTACSGGSTPKTEDNTQSEAAATESNTETATSDIKLAIIQKTLTSEFWQSIKKGAEERAAELGVTLDVYAANSEDDIEGQVTLLENALGKGYQAIGVAPISPVNLNSVIAQATEKGIYVVNIDEPVDIENLKGLGGAVQGLITTDNVAVGNKAGTFIVEQVGSGEVALIEGKAGVSSGQDRVDGVTAALEGTDLTIVDSQPADWDRTKAFNLAQNYLNKYPDLKAIYAANDTMAMGAYEAVKASGRDVVVVGTDGNSDAVESVEAGGLSATVKQDAETVGALSVDMMLELVDTKPPLDPEGEMTTSFAEAILVAKQ